MKKCLICKFCLQKENFCADSGKFCTDMPAKYSRGLRCRACEPPPVQQQEDQEEQVEDQEHLECCLEYAQRWDGLGQTTEESRVKYLYACQNEETETAAVELET